MLNCASDFLQFKKHFWGFESVDFSECTVVSGPWSIYLGLIVPKQSFRQFFFFFFGVESLSRSFSLSNKILKLVQNIACLVLAAAYAQRVQHIMRAQRICCSYNEHRCVRIGSNYNCRSIHNIGILTIRHISFDVL